MAKQSKNIFEQEISQAVLTQGLVASINRTYTGLIIIFLIQILFFTNTPNQQQTVVLAVAGATIAFYFMGRWAQRNLLKLLPTRIHLTSQALVLEYIRYPLIPMAPLQREWVHINLEQITAVLPGENPLTFMVYPSEIVPSYYLQTSERQYYLYLAEQAAVFEKELKKLQAKQT